MYGNNTSGHRNDELTVSVDASFLQVLGAPGQTSTMDWIARDDRPWNHQHMMPDVSSSYANREAFLAYRSAGVQSESETIPGDSGYGSYVPPNFDNASMYADESFDQPQVMDLAMEGLSFVMTAFEMDYSQQSQVSGSADNSASNPGKLWCESCRKNVKTNSDLKKHYMRHTKPFKCPIPECVSKGRGFASRNDLIRHNMSVHKEYGHGKTFKCPVDGCVRKGPDQRWPRADNFRSHLQRVHKIDVQADTDLSQYLSTHVDTEPQPVQQSPRGVDTLSGVEALSGVGTQYQDPVGSIATQGTTTIDMNGEFPDIEGKTNPHHVSEAEAQIAMYDGKLHNLMLAPTTRASSACEDTLDPKKTLNDFQYQAPKVQHQLDADTLNLIDDTRSVPVKPSSESNVESQVSDDLDLTNQDSDSGSDLNSDQLSVAENLRFMLTKVSSDEDLLECLRKIPKDLLQTACRGAEVGDQSTTSDDPRRSSCKVCNKTFNRPCELRKHAKRHERPYACTLPNCDKRFGSKNDWKRHEVGQHNPDEVWFCDQAGCDYFAQQREDLRFHLRKTHKIQEESVIGMKLENNRRGTHCLTSFWCGFCRTTIPVAVDDAAEYTSRRFDHIDKHFMGRGTFQKSRIEAWKHSEDHFAEVGEALGAKKRKTPPEHGDSRPKKKAHPGRT